MSPNQSVFGTVIVQNTGDIVQTPCPTKNNSLLGTVRLLDPNFNPFIVGAVNNFSIGNIGTLDNSGFFIGIASSWLLNQSGDSHIIYGTSSRLSVGGSYTNGSVIGNSIYLDNKLSTGGNSTLNGADIFVNGERTATEMNGLVVFSQTGGTGADATGTIRGIYSTAGVHNTAQTNVFASDLRILQATPTSGVQITTNASLINTSVINQASSTITNLKGLALSNWLNGGTVTTSYGIYADNSIDVGTTKYFIFSTSASPSSIAGDVAISVNGKGLILKSPDGTCYRLAVDNAGALSTASTTCP